MDQNDAARAGLDLVADVERTPMEAPPEPPATPDPEVLAYRPFPVEALPEPIRGFVVVSAQSIGCDDTFVLLPLLAALASAIGNTRRALLKPDWAEPSILWTAIVAESGDGKSPAVDRATQFCRLADRQAHQAYELLMKEYEVACQEHARDFGKWKSGKSLGAPPEKPEPPPRTRHTVGDTTVEAMACILEESPRGVLLVRDELSGWYGGIGQYKGAPAADEAHWLEMYGGREMVVDRKSAGASVYVPRASVSITGGLQPGVLRRVLTAERMEDGMAARLLPVMPPRRVRRWTSTSTPVESQQAMGDVFDRLYGLAPADHEGQIDPIDLPLTDEAQQLFIEFYDRHSEEQVELSGALASAWSKLQAIPARLSLILQCAKTDQFATAVDADSMRRALAMTDWFKQETRRIYAFLEETEDQARLRRTVELVQRLGGRATARDIQRRIRGATADDARNLLEEVRRDGLGTWEEVGPAPRGGRRTQALVLVDVDTTDTTSNRGGCVSSVDAPLETGKAENPPVGPAEGAPRGCVSSVNVDRGVEPPGEADGGCVSCVDGAGGPKAAGSNPEPEPSGPADGVDTTTQPPKPPTPPPTEPDDDSPGDLFSGLGPGRHPKPSD